MFARVKQVFSLTQLDPFVKRVAAPASSLLLRDLGLGVTLFKTLLSVYPPFQTCSSCYALV